MPSLGEKIQIQIESVFNDSGFKELQKDLEKVGGSIGDTKKEFDKMNSAFENVRGFTKMQKESGEMQSKLEALGLQLNETGEEFEKLGGESVEQGEALRRLSKHADITGSRLKELKQAQEIMADATEEGRYSVQRLDQAFDETVGSARQVARAARETDQTFEKVNQTLVNTNRRIEKTSSGALQLRNTMTGATQSIQRGFKDADQAASGFNFNMLSVMFGAMQARMMLMRFLGPAAQATGLSEELGATLESVTYPAMQDLTGILRPFLRELRTMPDIFKRLVTWAAMLGTGIATLVFFYAQWRLFVNGVVKEIVEQNNVLGKGMNRIRGFIGSLRGARDSTREFKTVLEGMPNTIKRASVEAENARASTEHFANSVRGLDLALDGANSAVAQTATETQAMSYTVQQAEAATTEASGSSSRLASALRRVRGAANAAGAGMKKVVAQNRMMAGMAVAGSLMSITMAAESMGVELGGAGQSAMAASMGLMAVAETGQAAKTVSDMLTVSNIRQTAASYANSAAHFANAAATKVATVAKIAYGLAVKFASGAVGLLTTALSGAAALILGTGTASAIASVGVTALGAAFNFLMSPVTLVAGAIVLIAGLLYVLYNNFELVAGAVMATLSPLAATIAAIMVLAKGLSKVSGVIGDIIGKLQFMRFFSDLAAGASSILKDAWKKSSKKLGQIFGSIVSAVEGMWNAMTPDNVGKKILKALKNPIKTLKGLWNGFKSFMAGIWSGIKNLPIIGQVARFLEDLFTDPISTMEDLWNGFKNFISDVWRSIKNLPVIGRVARFYENMFTDPIDTIKRQFRNVKDFISDVWNGIKNLPIIGKVASFYEDLFTDPVKTIKDTIKGIKETVSNVFTTIKNLDILQTVKDALSSLFSDPVSTMKEGFKSLVDVVKTAIQGIWDGIVNTIEAFKSLADKAGKSIGGLVDAVKNLSPGDALNSLFGGNNNNNDDDDDDDDDNTSSSSSSSNTGNSYLEEQADFLGVDTSDTSNDTDTSDSSDNNTNDTGADDTGNQGSEGPSSGGGGGGVVDTIGGVIDDAVGGAQDIIGGVGGSIGGAVGGLLNDFIIQPDGTVHRFSPNDTVMGLKHPEAINNTGGGKKTVNFNPNTTINITAEENVDVDELKDQLSREWVDELEGMIR